MQSITNKTEKSESKYPCLMEGGNGLVVLMTAPGEGTVVGPGIGTYEDKLGFHRCDWGMMYFKPFHGTVTLVDEG